MLSELELINWKTHKNSVLSFQKGVNLIIGIMGAGKSSVTDAISFALFGTFPDLTHRRIKLTGLITNKPKQEKYCEVRLSFSNNSSQYKVIRKIDEKGNSSAVLKKNNNTVQEQSIKVTEEIETILGINYDTFSKAIYSEQNRLNYFLDLPKNDRKKQIDEMLGLNQFSTAQENTVSLINNIKNSILDQEKTISAIDIKQFEEQISKLKKEFEEIKSEQDQLKKEFLSQNNELKVKQLKFEKARHENEIKEQISKQIIEIKSKIDTLKIESNKLIINFDEKELKHAFEKSMEEKLGLEKQLKELDNTKSLKSDKLKDIEHEIKQIKENKIEIQNIEKTLNQNNENEIKKEIENTKNLIEKLNRDYAYSEASKKEIKESIKNLDLNREKCPVCDRELDEEMRHNLIIKKSEQLIEIDKNIKETNKKIIDSNRQLNEHKEKADQLMLLKKQINKLKELIKDRNIEEYNQKYENLKSEIDSIKIKINEHNESKNNIINEINKINNNLDQLNKKQELMKNIEKNENELEAKQKKYSEITIDKNLFEALYNELNDYKTLIKTKELKIQSNQKYINNLEEQINEKNLQIEKFKEIENKIKIKKNKLNNLNKFKKAISEIQFSLRDRLILSVNKLMVNLWVELYPYSDFSSIRLTPKEDDYLLEINQRINDMNENWTPVNSIASGGEKSVSSLTLRIALSMVIVPNLKMLILDEPTHNLDANGINSFIRILDNTLPEIIEQVFVITHDESLKQMNSANIYILERDKNNNEPTKILNI
ncbi:MAG: SMC family ATPase [Candidatus Marsarchaeota archaeon]|nr:SMC family ATPase [Candidatus Marsarchaeota archaeon]MCL5094390.1 SMC family ATPase [Candidatus Marsarchaeota archaeon]